MLDSDRLALLNAVAADPESDTPRLVYADWLNEHGEAARAELIRVQCELARLGPDRRKGRVPRKTLEPRERELLAEHAGEWLAPFRAALAGSDPSGSDGWLAGLTMRRGFNHTPLRAWTLVRRLIEAGEALEPPDAVAVDCGRGNHDGYVAEVCGWCWAGCVANLSVERCDDRDIAALVESSRVRTLRHLDVWTGTVTDAGCARLAAWPGAASLLSLALVSNAITDAGALALADSPHFGGLQRLRLSYTRVGPSGERRLRERFGEVVEV